MSAFMWLVMYLAYGFWYILFNNSMELRFNKIITVSLELFIIALSNFMALSMPYMSAARMVLPTVMMLCGCFILYKEQAWRIIFIFLLVLMTTYLVEFLSLAFFFPQEYLDIYDVSVRQKGMVISYLLYLSLLALLLFVLWYILNRWRSRLGSKELLLFTGFPLSQIFLMGGWIRLVAKMGVELDLGYFLVVAAVSLAADAGLLAAVFYISQRRELQRENRSLAGLVSTQESYYSSLAGQYESMRRMRHDMDNQLLVMQELISRGEHDSASEYIDELLNKTVRDSSFCENLVVDAFLQTKQREAFKEGVALKGLIKLKNNLPLSNVDLIRAFGNLIDNALEGCRGIEGAEISLSCLPDRDYIVISSENPCRQQESRKARRIPGLERGIGTAVLKALAEKYSGSYTGERSGGSYRARLILRAEAAP